MIITLTGFRHRLTVSLLVWALAAGVPGSVRAAPIAINLQASFQFSGGGGQTESGLIFFDTETGLLTGTVESASAVPFNALVPILLACIFVCKYILPEKKASTGPSTSSASLFQQSNGNIESTMFTDFGVAGTAIFTSHLFGNTAIITGDLTGTDLSMLPAMAQSYTVNSNARAGGSAPGLAEGTSTVELLGLSIRNVFSHTLLGNMDAIVAERSVTSTLGVTSTGPTTIVLNGQASAQLIPEPTSLTLLIISMMALFLQSRLLNYWLGFERRPLAGL